MAHTQLTTRSKVSVGIAAVALVGLGAYGFAFLLQDQNPQVATNTSPTGSTPATEALDSCLFKCSYAEGFCLSDRYQKPENCTANRSRCETICRQQYVIDTRVATVNPDDAQMIVDVRDNPLRVYEIESSASLPMAMVNQPYQLQLTAKNVLPGTTLTWSRDESMRLPGGITFTSSGLFTGVPQEAGNFTVRIRVTSPTGQSEPRDFMLSVARATVVNNNPPQEEPPVVMVETPTSPLTITTNATLPAGQVGQGYTIHLTSERPAPNHEVMWGRTSGRLPIGISLSIDGTLSGTPTESGTFTFGLRAENSLMYVGTKTMTLVIAPRQVVIDSGSINKDVFITNPIEPPTQPQQASLKILTESNLPQATQGQAYSKQLVSSALPFPNSASSWAIIENRLPDGITLSANGLLSGTPTERGQMFQFRVRLTNTANATAEQTFFLVVLPATEVTLPPTATPGPITLTVSPAELPVGTVGQTYEQQLQTVEGQRLSYWTSDVTIPGLSLIKDGRLSGTPTQAGRFPFSVTGSDTPTVTGRTAYARRDFVVTIEAPMPSLVRGAVSPFPNGVVNQYYKHFPLAISGGSQPYVWRLENNRLPDGMTINQVTGVVSGTPTEKGTFSFSLRVNDAAGASINQNYTLIIAPAPVVVPPPVVDPKDPIKDPVVPTPPVVTPFYLGTINAFPSGTVGDSYSHRPMIVGGGREPYVWLVTSGKLPPGLSFDASGAVSGIPTAAGAFTFTIQSRDANGALLSTQFTVTISARSQYQYVQIYTADPQWPQRVNNINDLGMRVHDLIKLSDDGDPNTQYDTTVYYVGADGRRHAFPNPKVYFSWFSDYAGVRIVGSRQLANVPLGANITYRPGVRLVKFLTDPRVYAVDTQRRLRWIATERAAYDLYGEYWNRNVDDISDAFYMDYRFDAPAINVRNDFDPDRARRSTSYPSEVLP